MRRKENLEEKEKRKKRPRRKRYSGGGPEKRRKSRNWPHSYSDTESGRALPPLRLAKALDMLSFLGCDESPRPPINLDDVSIEKVFDTHFENF